MKVHVLLFGPARTAAKASEIQLDLGKNATVQEALKVLYRKFPGLQGMDGYVRCAVDEEYVSRKCGLRAGQTLALIPPVQGG